MFALGKMFVELDFGHMLSQEARERVRELMSPEPAVRTAAFEACRTLKGGV